MYGTTRHDGFGLGTEGLAVLIAGMNYAEDCIGLHEPLRSKFSFAQPHFLFFLPVGFRILLHWVCFNECINIFWSLL